MIVALIVGGIGAVAFVLIVYLLVREIFPRPIPPPA